MGSNADLTSILSNLKEKHKLLSRIFEVTKSLECVSLDDEMSISSFLGNRQTAMNAIDAIDKKNRQLVNGLPSGIKEQIKSLLSPTGETLTLENKLQTDIFDANKHNIMLLKRIVEADERFNKKVRKKLGAP